LYNVYLQEDLASGDGGLLTAEEMNQLMDVAEEIAKTVEKPKQIEAPTQEEIDK
jgi:hypothetical protein